MTASVDNGWELSISRNIAAAPETVWQIMTQRTSEWWCPKPWSTEIIQQDWRTGGRNAVIMRGPDGEESSSEGVFLEVIPYRQAVFTDAFSKADDWLPQTAFMLGAFELSPEDGSTCYVGWSRHWTEAAMQNIVLWVLLRASRR